MKKIVFFLCALFLTCLSVNASAGPGCNELEGVSGSFPGQIISGGKTRTYKIYVQTKYKNNRPTPLVVDFHGFGMSALFQYQYTQMWALAEKFKFILVTPQGIENSWNAGNCCDPAKNLGVQDVQFVSDMIDQIMEDYCINPNRIFATGFSNGGSLSIRLGCDLSDRIAAIAPVASGGLPLSCKPSRPVPIISFKGTADPTYGKALIAIEMARQKNGCSNETEIYYQEGDVTCIAYKDCDENASVVFCEIEGGGHNWPGTWDLCEYVGPIICELYKIGYTTQDIDASRAIWKFFAEHSMPE